ncbi:MAG: prepilin peptidase [Chloroflexi bacterium]|nr:MAG: prepilin peptidase [Chloroflexota bacterium]
MGGALLVVITVLGALAGGGLGSFSGVVAARGWRGALTGRSRCDACGRELRGWELVTVVSWVALSGRCARCEARIPVSLLLGELAGGAVGAGVVLAIACR